jgi:hypothetical protein
MSSCCNGCPCDEATKGRNCLTTYRDRTCVRDPKDWEVEVPGRVKCIVPATTEFFKDASCLPWDDKTLCKAGCAKVQVLSGTLFMLDKPMGPNGAQQYGEKIPATAVLVGPAMREASWYSPDGAEVLVTLYEGPCKDQGMLVCDCGSGSGSVVIIDPSSLPIPVTIENQKFVGFCDQWYQLNGETECKCGKWQIVSSCSRNGTITEVSRVLLGEDCRPLASGTYTPVDKIAQGDLVWKRECTFANFNLLPASNRTYTVSDLIAEAIRCGYSRFPSGEIVDGACPVSNLDIALMNCGNEVGVLDAQDHTTAAEAVVNLAGGCLINFDQESSRTFQAEEGYPIQGFQSLEVAGGSGVAICMKICSWYQTIACE